MANSKYFSRKFFGICKILLLSDGRTLSASKKMFFYGQKVQHDKQVSNLWFFRTLCGTWQTINAVDLRAKLWPILPHFASNFILHLATLLWDPPDLNPFHLNSLFAWFHRISRSILSLISARFWFSFGWNSVEIFTNFCSICPFESIFPLPKFRYSFLSLFGPY